ncbi:MAG: hypothetical protein GYB64_16675 [Chloroflexi bacterium]|nr:hypothetical protein [Chloroflexota bacterium]
MIYRQPGYDIICEWGQEGLEQLGPTADAIIIVDVFSFCTCVDVATANGAVIYPFPYNDESAQAFADEKKALLAGENEYGYELSPASLLTIPERTRLVLPSMNGSALSSLIGDEAPTFAGCLRNARAVAIAARQFGRRVAVIPAGERWRHSRTMRPALEDWLGAGAVVSYLSGNLSPEAEAAAAAFEHARHHLVDALARTASGQELFEHDMADTIDIAAALNHSAAAPRLIGGAYIA